MHAYLHEFCAQFSYPPQAEAAFQEALSVIEAHGEAARLLEENQRLLWEGRLPGVGEDIPRLDRIAALTGLHPYTVYAVYFILCSERLRQRYVEEGLPLEYFRDSMLDIKWKLQKTKTLFDVWGVKWGPWFKDFYLLKRFGMGRLEFEIIGSVVDYEDLGRMIHKGDPVVNIHIPAAGPLRHELVEDSYRKAAAFYRDQFPDGVIPFQCESWLLYPRTAQLFPEGNLRRFYQDFDIAAAGLVPQEDDRWRIFHVPATVPMEQWPEETTLQKIFKPWLLAGNVMGDGVGMFFYENGHILPPGGKQRELHEMDILELSTPCYNV